MRVSSLSIRRGEATILDQVDWAVGQGEHWVILGPNGCGKTSLLLALTGYLPPTSGTVELLGETFGRRDWRRLRERVGIVSQSISLRIREEQTALETVVSGRHAILNPWEEPGAAEARRAGRLLKNLGIRHLANRSWLVLSQGERQRVLIARALMPGPEILLLDEPCSGLDPVARETFLAQIGALADQLNVPLILITHHVEEIIPAITHTLLLQNGKVTASGPVRETLNSRNLSTVFGTPLHLRRSGDRYQLRLPATAAG